MSSSSRPKDAKSELKRKMQSSGKKQTAKNKGEKSFVSKKKTRKRRKKLFSNVGSKKRVLQKKNRIDLDSTSDEEGFECLGEMKVRKSSILSGNIVLNTSSSSSSSEDDEDLVGFEIVGKNIDVKNVSFSKNVRDLRANEVSRNDKAIFVKSVGVKSTHNVDGFVDNVDDDEDEDGFEVLGEKIAQNVSFSKTVRDSRPNEVSRDDNTEPASSVGIKGTPRVDGFAEDLGGDGFGILGENGSFSKNEVSRNENTDPVHSLGVKSMSRVDNFVENVGGDSDEDGDGFEISGEKMVKNGSFSKNEVSRDENSVPRVDDSFVENVGGDSDGWTDGLLDLNMDELESSCEEEEDMDDSDKENDIILDKTFTMYRGFTGIEVMMDFDECSNEGERTSKSQKEVPPVGEFDQPKPVMECEAQKDENSNSSKGECSNEKKPSCEEEVGKQLKGSARNAELNRISLNRVNGDRNVEESGLVQPLPPKFRFEDEVTDPTPEQTEWDKQIDSLFLELYYCLQMIEKAENENAVSKVVGESPAASCAHDPVLDEHIGSFCRLCGVILLEIKDILPPWYTPHLKRQEKKYFGESTNHVSNELQFHNVDGPHESVRVQGNVKDLTDV